MKKQEVVRLMLSSKNEKEWNSNCDIIKIQCNGYPEFWYKEIIETGIAKGFQMYFIHDIRIDCFIDKNIIDEYFIKDEFDTLFLKEKYEN